MPQWGPCENPTGPQVSVRTDVVQIIAQIKCNDKPGVNVQIRAVPMRKASQEGSCLGPGKGLWGVTHEEEVRTA